jgi:hypothetical protein
MSVMTTRDGSRWADTCALCNSSRRFEDERECPWCRAVRLKHGSYWYPITESNKHLFTTGATGSAPASGQDKGGKHG